MPKFNTRIEVREADPFGPPPAVRSDAAPRDRFWLTGYSDRRREWSAEYARYVRGERGTAPTPLDYRVHFTSVERASGAPDGASKAEKAARGYRPLKWEEAGNFGIDLTDSAAVRDADGNIRVGSQIAMITDREHAAAHLDEVRERGRDQHRAVEDRMQAVAADFNKRMGLSEGGGTAFELAQEDSSDA